MQASRIVCLLLVIALTVPAIAHTATASPSQREVRASAIIAALSTGDTAAYERAAQANFARAMLARRTPEQRAEFVATMHADFGALTVVKMAHDAGTLRADVRGKAEKMAVLTFSFDTTLANLIQGIELRVGGGGDADANAPAIPPPPITAAMPQAGMSRALDAWLFPFVARDDFAGVVLIAREGAPFVVRVYGPANRVRQIANTEDTAFNIASIGKKFTQTAIAKLIQDGRLKLTSTIGELLPDYPNPAARTATIQHLITMRGGIADFFGPEFEKAEKTRFNSNHAYYEFVSKLQQRFAPGTRNEYCNGCYVVLGEIIERVSGTRFEDYVQRHVFAPAAMTRSGYFNSASLPANTAVSYGRVRGPGTPYENTRALHGATGSGAGGVYATAKDLLAFDNALRDGRLLNPEQTAWVLGGTATTGRNPAPLGVAGGSPGTNAILESNGHWTVILLANVDPPLPERLGLAIARKLAE